MKTLVEALDLVEGAYSMLWHLESEFGTRIKFDVGHIRGGWYVDVWVHHAEGGEGVPGLKLRAKDESDVADVERQVRKFFRSWGLGE